MPRPQPDSSWPDELKEAMKDQFYREFDLEAARKAAIEKLAAGHDWHQEGPYAVCSSCETRHSQHIGADMNLKRDEKGVYTLQKRVFRSSPIPVQNTPTTLII